MNKQTLEKGFTLVEILIIISIISILFILTVSQVTSYFTKANETGVRTDFREFQLGAEQYLKELQGKNLTMNGLNNYIDPVHKIALIDSLLKTKSVDSWGNAYVVSINSQKIMFSSQGKNEDPSYKAYILASYYYNGTVTSCTSGFSTNNLHITNVPNLSADFICGEELVPVSDTIPIASLNAPSNFKTTVVTSTQATLTWDAVSDATSYILKKNGVTIYTGSNTSYSDITLQAGTTYTYTVVARSATTTSTASHLTVTTTETSVSTPPEEPTEETIKLPNQGTGKCSPYDPYIITTIGELQGMKLDLDGCFELGNNIDASLTSSWNSGEGFAPVGHYDYDAKVYYAFTGKLDGKGRTITQLTVNRPNENDIGLFGVFMGEAKNIVFEEADIIGKGYVGILSGDAKKSTISNIQVDGEATGGSRVGSLVGSNDGIVSTITTTKNTSVKGTSRVGGLIGDNISTGKIDNASSNAMVEGTTIIGGVIGYSSGELTNSSYNATISGGSQVGGAVGQNQGIISYFTSGNDAVVKGTIYIGGAVGFHSGKLMNSSYNASVSGGDQVGGAVGQNHGLVSYFTSTNSAVVEGKNYVGGVIGYNIASGKIDRASSSATVNGFKDVGGIIGMSIGEVTSSVAEAIVNGDDHVAGVVGRNEGLIQNVVSKSVVTGRIFVGGLAGHSRRGEVINTYAVGKVTGVEIVGGLFGRLGNSPLTSSYFDMSMTGQPQTTGDGYQGGGVGKTTEEMKEQATYVGWDFVNVWNMNSAINHGYPTLK